MARINLAAGRRYPGRDGYAAAKAFYEKNKPRILSEYRGRYIAIVDDTVIDSDPDYSALAERVFAAHGVRSLFMPLVQEASKAIRMKRPPSVRRARV